MMQSSRLRAIAPLVFSLALPACRESNAALEAPPPPASAAPSPPSPPPDPELLACRARGQKALASPELPGAPEFDAARTSILGRARGEPMVFVREPKATPDEALEPAWLASRERFEKTKPGRRVHDLVKRHRREPEALRALVLREGYLYTPEPLDALALVTQLSLADLFQEPSIWLHRGTQVFRLERFEKRREVGYRYAEGSLEGQNAELLFGDRVALSKDELASPLHRDLRELAERDGFERARILRRSEDALFAELRYGTRWVKAWISSKDARLELDCIEEERQARESVRAWKEANAPRLRALAAIREAISALVAERLRFDRPQGEEGPDRDGQLRPFWYSAYLRGQRSFEFDDKIYSVFDSEGRAWPPEVCVDFVLDSFERASGSWYRGVAAPGRTKGRLDFNEMGIANRRGVIAFGLFAENATELFETRRFEDEERILFRDREKYFAFLTEHADEIRPGDVVAIRGRKRDGRIHQHAILVEYVDPITAMPCGLADQMKRPRRRTWEGIMAEAPLRSLYYRVRPREGIFASVDPGSEEE